MVNSILFQANGGRLVLAGLMISHAEVAVENCDDGYEVWAWVGCPVPIPWVFRIACQMLVTTHGIPPMSQMGRPYPKEP